MSHHKEHHRGSHIGILVKDLGRSVGVSGMPTEHFKRRIGLATGGPAVSTMPSNVPIYSKGNDIGESDAPQMRKGGRMKDPLKAAVKPYRKGGHCSRKHHDEGGEAEEKMYRRGGHCSPKRRAEGGETEEKEEKMYRHGGRARRAEGGEMEESRAEEKKRGGHMHSHHGHHSHMKKREHHDFGDVVGTIGNIASTILPFLLKEGGHAHPKKRLKRAMGGVGKIRKGIIPGDGAV